jgi:ribosomal protein L32
MTHSTLSLCERCGEYIARTHQSCPRCAEDAFTSRRLGQRGKALAAALGVTLTLGGVACQSSKHGGFAAPVYGGPPTEEIADKPDPDSTPDMSTSEADMPPDMKQVRQDMKSEPMMVPVYGGPPEG